MAQKIILIFFLDLVIKFTYERRSKTYSNLAKFFCLKENQINPSCWPYQLRLYLKITNF